MNSRRFTDYRYTEDQTVAQQRMGWCITAEVVADVRFG